MVAAAWVAVAVPALHVSIKTKGVTRELCVCASEHEYV